MKKYDKFVQLDNDFQPIPDVIVQNKLPPGVYNVNQNQSGELFFSKIKTNHDSLVDLPNTEYDLIVKEISLFMDPKTKKLFDENGFIYKRSTLLEGPPGAGKTCTVNRVAQKVMDDGGVVLFSPNPKLLEEAFTALDSIQPETRVMVIFEELDRLIQDYETPLLNLLDGEIQKSNVIYMATTNYIDRIPSRIRRPGRFSSVIHVGFPSKETRHFYLQKKLGDKIDVDAWVSKTQGFSIDELKETVLAVLCLSYDLDSIIDRIKVNKDNISVEENENEEDYEEQEDDGWTGIFGGGGLQVKKGKNRR